MSNDQTSSSGLPAPRYALGWAALAYILAALTLAYPALTGGFLVAPHSDQYIGGFPVRDFAAQSLKAGLGIPLWNPYLLGGMPYVAAMGVGDVFYPTALLRALLPVDIAMTLGFVIHVVLAGLFTYMFCRAIGLGFLSSLIGGAAYMMGGPVTSMVSPGHDGKLFVSALLPMFLLMLLRGVREGRAWSWGALAIVTGLAVLSPHPQLLQYMLLTGGFFALYLAFSRAPDGNSLSRKVAFTRIGYALGAVLLGGAIGAVQYSGVPGYVPFSPRAGGTAYQFATSFSFPIEELFNMYLPEFTGILDSYWGRNDIHFHSEYIGATVLILATAAVWANGKAMAQARSFKLFMLGVLIVSTLWALGGNTPFYWLVYTIVPGTRYFRAPSTIIYVTAFAIAVFAAIGAERVLLAAMSRRFMVGWASAAALVTLVGVAGGLTNVGATINASYRTSYARALGANEAQIGDYVAQTTELVKDNDGAVRLGSVRSFFFVALTLFLLWGAGNGRMSPTIAGLALLGAVTADLWSIERKYWQFSPRASTLYASDATIDYLKLRSDSARVWAYALDGRAAGRDAVLRYDGLMVHGVRQITGYHGNEIARYSRLIEDSTGRPTLPLSSPGIRSLVNLQYLLTNVPPTNDGMRMFPGATLVAGPARNAFGNMVYLYKLPGENPPAFVATAAFKVDDAPALATLQDQRFNADMQKRVAFIDTGSKTAALADLKTLPVASTISARVRRPTHSKIVVELSAPAQQGNMLVVSENWFPGWTARIDGSEGTTERADYSMIGVPLTAGARLVELEFTSRSYASGKMISLGALAVAVALVLAGIVLGGSGKSVGWGREPVTGAA